MGGYGSGPRRRKGLVESCRSIDTSDLLRWKLLGAGTRSGALRWAGVSGRPDTTVGYELAVGDGGGTLRLAYTIPPAADELVYAVRLVTTRCHRGGVRWWFVCPLARGGVACGRRARKLYHRGRYFGCRVCHDLTYTSTRESDSRVYAAIRSGDVSYANPDRMSVGRLGFLLKVIAHERRKLDRHDRRLSDWPRAPMSSE